MRHNQNGRHMRGGRRGGNGGGGGGGNHHHHSSGNSGGGGHNGQRRVNPRVQTFDSNGPDVRIRGNAFQINEKYMTLARDAASAGDRVLAESYYQHAEHYQRFINEMNEEFARQNPNVQIPAFEGQQQQPSVADEGAPQPTVGLNDLDQGFLVGPRQEAAVPPPPEGQPQPEQRQQRHRNFPRQPETEAV